MQVSFAQCDVCGVIKGTEYIDIIEFLVEQLPEGYCGETNGSVTEICNKCSAKIEKFIVGLMKKGKLVKKVKP